MRHLRAWQADLLLLAVAFIWGTTFVLVKDALNHITPLTFISIRFILGFFFLYLIYRPGKGILARPVLKAGLVIGFWLFAGYAFQTVGLQYTSAANAGFITGLSVILVPFFSIGLTKVWPNRYVVGGALMAAVGLALMTLGPDLVLQKGDVLVFFCACAFALHIIFVGRYAQEYNPIHLALLQLLTVGLLSALIAIIAPWETGPAAWTGQLWLALGVTSVLATALAFLVQNSVQRFTSPSRTAIVLAMEPVFAALTAYTYGGEELTVKALLGAILVMAGIILAELKGNN